MTARGFVKANWRVLLLVVLVSVSLYALFVPGGMIAQPGQPADDAEDVDGPTIDTNASETDENGSGTDGNGSESGTGESISEANDSGDGADTETNDSQTAAVEDGGGPTNLAFGLGLDGGTRISAPPVGSTAEDVDLNGEDRGDVMRTVQDELGLDPADVTVRIEAEEGSAGAEERTVDVEIFTNDVTDEAFVAALDAAGVAASEDDVRDGVTQQTRDEIVETIDQRINAAGLSGGRVFDSAAPNGQHYIVTEAPAMSADELRNTLEARGSVEVVAYHPGGEDGAQRNDTVLTQDDIADPGSASQDDSGGHYVPVVVAENRAPEFQSTMNEYGFSEEGAGQCTISDPNTGEISFDGDSEQYCLLTVVDGEVVAAHSMSQGLGSSLASEQWAEDPIFQMGASSQAEAHQLSINLQSGSLRAPLDFGDAQIFSVEPALAEQFKSFSLLIGLLSVIAVSGVVYLRYRDRRVAGPMVLTASAEVVILLGFAAAIRMPLDLAHVAGFIAVVGTGVDDLVIIADEVMDEGDVSQRRVFDSRFKKAFWVIGAAAATTIIAMSPLAVLSLGDLQGFAIVTILGVLIGVFVTRPAYGDILRRLLVDE